MLKQLLSVSDIAFSILQFLPAKDLCKVSLLTSKATTAAISKNQTIQKIIDGCEKPFLAAKKAYEDERTKLKAKHQKPLADAAKKAKALKPMTFREVMAFARPPIAVEAVTVAAAIVFYPKEKRDTWSTAKKLMGEVKLISWLQEINDSKIAPGKAAEFLKAVSGISHKQLEQISGAATALYDILHPWCTISVELGEQAKVVQAQEKRIQMLKKCIKN